MTWVTCLGLEYIFTNPTKFSDVCKNGRQRRRHGLHDLLATVEFSIDFCRSAMFNEKLHGAEVLRITAPLQPRKTVLSIVRLLASIHHVGDFLYHAI